MEPAAARRGRPRKYGAPSRAISVTLPEHVIEALAGIDADLGRAIVRLATGRRPSPRRRAELTHFGRHAIIVVNPTRALADRVGVELVPLPDGRAIIAFPPATSAADLELLIEDALEAGALSAGDRETFEAILSIIRSARRSGAVSLLQRSILVLETRRARGGRSGPRSS